MLYITLKAELSKEIGRYEAVTGAKINREKSVGLRLGLWKGCALPGPFIWSDSSCKILGVWFGPDFQLEKNWSEVLENKIIVIIFTNPSALAGYDTRSFLSGV